MFSRITTKCFRNTTISATAKEVLLQTKYNVCPLNRSESTNLKHAIQEALKPTKEAIKKFREEQDATKMGEIKVENAIGGMRGLTLLVHEPSLVDPEEGIIFRDKQIPQVRECLPKGSHGEEPLPEGLFWLLCTGKIPTAEEVNWMTKEWNERSEVPEHIYDMVLNLPRKLHPMSKLSAAITAMSIGSCLKKAIEAKEKKSKLWEIKELDISGDDLDPSPPDYSTMDKVGKKQFQFYKGALTSNRGPWLVEVRQQQFSLDMQEF